MFPTMVARALKQDPYFSRMESGRARLQPVSERSHFCIICKFWLRRILELFDVSRLDLSPQCDRTSLHALTSEALLFLRSSFVCRRPLSHRRPWRAQDVLHTHTSHTSSRHWSTIDQDSLLLCVAMAVSDCIVSLFSLIVVVLPFYDISHT